MSSINVVYRRSPFCNADGCVEVHVGADLVLVRDSKLGVFSPVAKFTRAEWERLCANPALLWLALAVEGLRFTSSEMVAFELGINEFVLAVA